ncbi:hypothetical protein QF037_004132 [Streptomyces canus]|uniref:hypothetical protein n=1 Tax=Streptomyces canus TaxID=58343 RepID=UPI00278857D8|nr:hypothetical protein [Streptomyces canus]MDQ0599787.1 hypothetical protein [Streptomyces canus]
MASMEAVLLPIGGAALASDPRVAEAVRAIGARTGVDYTDDRQVTALLAERRRAATAAQHRPLAWAGGIALLACVVWPFVAVSAPSLGPKAALAAGPLLILAVAALTRVRANWKRELLHPALAGYREVLGVARAHGMPPAHVPAWLEGKAEGGSGKGATPIPSYPDAGAPSPQGASGGAVPPKPAAVTEYERLASSGGWHDETGWLLLFAGAGGAAWAWSQTEPIGYAALVLIPVAIGIWLAGSHHGSEETRLRAEAVQYVRSVIAAQAAGARVPELSPALRKLLND